MLAPLLMLQALMLLTPLLTTVPANAVALLMLRALVLLTSLPKPIPLMLARAPRLMLMTLAIRGPHPMYVTAVPKFAYLSCYCDYKCHKTLVKSCIPTFTSFA
jgi:hypothetical protein